MTSATSSYNVANTVTVDETGTLVETDTTKFNGAYMQLVPSSLMSNFVDVPVAIDIEILERDKYTLSYPVKKTDNTTTYPSTNLTGQIHIEVTEDSIKLYQDEVLKSTTNGNFAQARAYLQLTRANGDGSVKFKNLMIYPI